MPPRVRRGFTILEGLTAVAILAIVGIGVVSGVTMTRQLAELDKQRIAAISAARRYLEQRGRRDLYPTISPIANVVLDDFNTPEGGDDLEASLTCRLFSVNADGTRGAELAGSPANDNRIEIMITVSWNRTGSRSATRVSETLRTYAAPDL